MSFVDTPIRDVRRNDLVYVDSAWTRVVSVTKFSWGSVRVDFPDGTYIIRMGDELVSVRRFRVLRGGKAA